MTTFADKRVTTKENILIVDALNLCFRWKPRGEKEVQFVANTGKLSYATEFITTVKSLAKSYEAGTIIVAADWGGSTYRKEIYPEYKANRKDVVATQTKEEEKASRAFFNEYERALQLAEDDKSIIFLRYKGVEADDIAAYISGRLDVFGFHQAWLISSDRDWDLLVNEKVSRFSTVTRKEITLDTWEHPVKPEDYISLKVLHGDKGDNITGIDGIGEVRAAGLIKKYGTAYDIYHSCPLPGTAKYIKNLNENKELLLRNYDLMDLVTNCEEAIGHINVQDICRRLTFD